MLGPTGGTTSGIAGAEGFVVVVEGGDSGLDGASGVVLGNLSLAALVDSGWLVETTVLSSVVAVEPDMGLIVVIAISIFCFVVADGSLVIVESFLRPA